MEIRGKAPLRISFAGGGTDLNYVFEKHGGLVINSTIDKYIHMTIKKRKDKQIICNSEIKDIVNNLVKYLKIKFGFELECYNDLEGKGLGASSSFTVLLITLLTELAGKRYDDYKIVELAYDFETILGFGGWQDQYAASVGGFSLIEFNKDNKTVYPLRLKYSIIRELEEWLVLCEVGGTRDSGKIQKIIKDKSDIDHLVNLIKMKEIANKIKFSLLNGRIEEIGKLLDESWKLKRNKYTTTKQLDKIYKLAKSKGANGKLLGAGQAGFFLFFINPNKRNKLISVLNKEKCKIHPFKFAPQGVETWRP